MGLVTLIRVERGPAGLGLSMEAKGSINKSSKPSWGTQEINQKLKSGFSQEKSNFKTPSAPLELMIQSTVLKNLLVKK